MPRPDRARAEPAAIQRAALCPKHHLIEGIACSHGTDPHWDVMPSGEPGGTGGTPVHAALKRLDGKRVRVTIEVLPPEGDAE